MNQQEGMSSSREPLLKGNGYSLWSVRMKGYIMSLGCDIWKYVEDGYTAPTTTPTDIAKKKHCNGNAKAANSILGGIDQSYICECNAL
jgi:hypothetical protein